MEVYRAIKRMESFSPEELVLLLSRFQLTQCSKMITEEKINGEEFFNITSEKMDPHLSKSQQDHVLMLRNCILENPIEFLEKYEDSSTQSSEENSDYCRLSRISSLEEDSNAMKVELKSNDYLNRKTAEAKPPLPNKPKNLSPALFKYGELSTNEQFYNVDHSEGVSILKNKQTGAYIIRPSRSESCYCTLMIKTEKDIVNVQIAKKEDKYYLYSADKYSEICFKDISSLLAHFAINTMPLPLNGVLLCDNKSKRQTGTFFLP